MNEKTIRIAGLVLTGVGAVVSIASSLVEEKSLDFKVAEAVKEALKKDQ